MIFGNIWRHFSFTVDGQITIGIQWVDAVDVTKHTGKVLQ